jgi:DNA invertase Pin-like site-specific DNA recombinase
MGRAGSGRVGNVIGYARVSTVDQNLDSQLDALRRAGAVRVFTDKLSGSTTARPQLQACLEYLNPGDVLAVYSTDRLGRSVGDLIEIVGKLREQGIQFKSLTEPFDTTDHGGELFFHIVAAFAQMQRRQISEKTRAGLAAAKARGRLGGRPTVMDSARIELARRMRSEGKSFDDIAMVLRVGASSVKRALRTSTPAAPSPSNHEE